MAAVRSDVEPKMRLTPLPHFAAGTSTREGAFLPAPAHGCETNTPPNIPGACPKSAIQNPKSAMARSSLFHDRLAHDFLDRRDAVVDRVQAALAEGAHAALAGFHAEDLRAGVLDDHVAHLVVEQHDLVHA